MKDIEREGAVVSGHVKWYDAVKGYGFVVPDDGGSDVMVHASCVRAFGRMALSEGARVNLVATASPRGLQASKLVEVNEPEGQALPGPDDDARPTEFLGQDLETGPLQPARVKWFDKQKGFGFVNVFGNTEDVFVHMETVRRCGFQDLSSGEGMAVRTFRGPRGLMVAELRLWETAVQDRPVQPVQPVQDVSIQERPAQDRFAEDPFAQDRPAQERPAQHGPAQHGPAQHGTPAPDRAPDRTQARAQERAVQD